MYKMLVMVGQNLKIKRSHVPPALTVPHRGKENYSVTSVDIRLISAVSGDVGMRVIPRGIEARTGVHLAVNTQPEGQPRSACPLPSVIKYAVDVTGL